MKGKTWIKNLKEKFKFPTPIWETPQWEEMSWDEKMTIWRKHKKINKVLVYIYLICFVGSLLWVSKTATDAKIIFVFNAVMIICLFIARFFMD